MNVKHVHSRDGNRSVRTQENAVLSVRMDGHAQTDVKSSGILALRNEHESLASQLEVLRKQMATAHQGARFGHVTCKTARCKRSDKLNMDTPFFPRISSIAIGSQPRFILRGKCLFI